MARLTPALLLRCLGCTLGLGVALAGRPAAAQNVYETPAAFLAEAFPAGVPEPQILSLSPEKRQEIARILRHSYNAERVRTWKEGARTAWILEEIGKYKPITIGVVVANGKIEDVRVLIYRETHGWEVRHDFFTDQFKGLTLEEGNRLSARIDGISGATLSVNALQSVARLALYLDKAVEAQ
jgi:uncharacterized protein with FMN-binding domain